MSNTKAVIYEAVEANPDTDRLVTRWSGGQIVFIAVPGPEVGLQVAVGLAEDGVELIELCGGFGLPLHAAALAAIGDRTPVWAILYGIESLAPAYAFNQRYEQGATQRGAFIYLSPEADPATDRATRQDGTLTTVFAAARNATEAADIAAALADEPAGLHLVELYGGVGPDWAAAVLEKVGGRAAVGLPSYPPSA
ncbi:hypothetical protein DFR70_12241 [Nocardia tenerifensis]|uniref:Uncharacterized protein n=1 Tax=Nocardia tenerifensis TaxID=228006 RepID=A0A318JSD9_9NOCA|nr:DUF6506 family protein [Nocardia tenerifensis]PXX54900.1 hypothetical protein DFR70_12241 [Nocardia tenerifensis]